MQIKCEAELEESVAPFGLHWNGFGAVSKGFRDGVFNASMLPRCFSGTCHDAGRWVSFRISIGSGNKTAAVRMMASKGCLMLDIQCV